MAQPSQRNPWPCNQGILCPQNAQSTYVDPLLKRPLQKLPKRNCLEGSSPLIDSQAWREVLHPSRPVVVVGQIPPISWAPGRGLIVGALVRGLFDASRPDDKLKAQNTKSEPTSPTRALDMCQCVTWHVTPPPDPLQIAAVMEPTVATHEHQLHCKG